MAADVDTSVTLESTGDHLLLASSYLEVSFVRHDASAESGSVFAMKIGRPCRERYRTKMANGYVHLSQSKTVFTGELGGR
jgi:hypothetical protein